MLGWELRLRVTKYNEISKSSQMRNKKSRKNRAKKQVTKITQISLGEGLREGLNEGLRELMENSARDSGELRGGLRNSGNSDHPFWRTQGRTQGAPPSVVTRIENN